ncbi:MAG: glycoside hydrolase family 3 protein [Gammaproteobacteria bacterium]|nr:glycoside hydrolase family 3 protein [Gammaproteobacteria bacterium]
MLTGCSEKPSHDQTEQPNNDATQANQLAVQTTSKAVIEQDGLTFRDLNADGKLTPYEDWRLPVEQRVTDLLARMTLEEKAGEMIHGTLPGKNGFAGFSQQGYDIDVATSLFKDKHIGSYISRLNMSPADLAVENNKVQALAETTRLGIPAIISTDPRNHFQYVLGANETTDGFTQWPEPLGFGALNDPQVTEQFGDITRQEYRATGFTMALSPQADLATEPRWSRIIATFGSDAVEVSQQVGAYIRGFQGSSDGITPEGVSTVTKHWVGYGAAVEGFDGHNYYGRNAQLDDTSIEDHIRAFDGAFEAKTTGIMPAYPILHGITVDGEPVEAVSAGYNKQILQNLLRRDAGFKGVVISDWAITRDCSEECKAPTKPQGVGEIATPWGVEDLSIPERFVKGITAGIDQFGGEDQPEIIVNAVKEGKLTEDRINESASRILALKFELGLFDNPYVNEPNAATNVGKPEWQRLAHEVQAKSQVLLKNTETLLPLAETMKKVFVDGLSAEALTARGFEVVSDLTQADFAIFRFSTPSEKLHPNHFFGSRQNEGRLSFDEEDEKYQKMLSVSQQVPTILSVFLERPIVLGELNNTATAILANFGCTDDALIDVITGKIPPVGTLPLELPSSDNAVESQKADYADDSKEPLYKYRYGLKY